MKVKQTALPHCKRGKGRRRPFLNVLVLVERQANRPIAPALFATGENGFHLDSDCTAVDLMLTSLHTLGVFAQKCAMSYSTRTHAQNDVIIT